MAPRGPIELAPPVELLREPRVRREVVRPGEQRLVHREEEVRAHRRHDRRHRLVELFPFVRGHGRDFRGLVDALQMRRHFALVHLVHQALEMRRLRQKRRRRDQCDDEIGNQRFSWDGMGVPAQRRVQRQRLLQQQDQRAAHALPLPEPRFHHRRPADHPRHPLQSVAPEVVLLLLV